MSFKKVGINYISDKLLKCLLQDGSKYYVELKNGIRIPVAQADYEAIATDLVVVNGVAYADLSVIASCKQLVGGYIVEFANGNQLTTTELNFNALVAAGFCAIGDTYYNPSQIDKLYEADGAYFAVMANGQRVGMTEEEYEEVTGGGSATTYPIAVTVENGSYSGDTEIEEGGTATVTLVAGEGFVLPDAISLSGSTYTYNQETGIVSLSEATGPVSITCVCEQDQPAGGLTEFVNNDSFGATSLKCNISMSNADITAVLADIANETALISLDMGGNVREFLLVDEDEDGGKQLIVADLPIFVSNEYSYEDKDTGETITIPAGWQYDFVDGDTTVEIIDRTTGVADLSILLSDQSFPCVVNSEVSGWNGIIIGKNEVKENG